MSLRRLRDAAAAAAEEAGHAGLASSIRARGDEAGVLAAIRTGVTQPKQRSLLQAGLFGAVVDHAKGGLEALAQTGDALVIAGGWAHPLRDELLARGQGFLVPRHETDLVVSAETDGNARLRGAAAVLRANPHIWSVNVSGVTDGESPEPVGGLGALFGAISDTGSVEELEIEDGVLGRGCAEILGAMLRAGSGPERLVLGRLGLGDGALEPLAAGIAACGKPLWLRVWGLVLDGPSCSRLLSAAAAGARVREISAAACPSGDAELTALAACLGGSTSVRRLTLRPAAFPAGGLAALGGAVGECASLRDVCLSGFGLEGPGLDALAAGCGDSTSLRDLSLHTARLGPEGARALGRAASRSTSLTKLDLSSCELDGPDLALLAEGLARSRSLRELRLTTAPSGRAGLAGLARALGLAPRLATLGVSGTGIDAPAFAAGLASAPALTHVDLVGIALAPGTLAGVFAALCDRSHPLRLDLSDAQGRDVIDDATAAALAGATCLTGLDLGGLPGVCTGRAALLARVLGSLPRLTGLSVRRWGLARGDALSMLEGLAAGPGMEWLDMEGCALGDRGAACLATALPSWAGRLRRLRVTHKKPSAAGVAALIEGLSCCTALQDLALHTKLWPRHVADAGRLVRRCPGMKSLVLGGVKRGCNWADQLAAAVRAQGSLELLTVREQGGLEASSRAVLAATTANRRAAWLRTRPWFRRGGLVLWRAAQR